MQHEPGNERTEVVIQLPLHTSPWNGISSNVGVVNHLRDHEWIIRKLFTLWILFLVGEIKYQNTVKKELTRYLNCK